MNNENENFTINQSVLWKQASKVLQRFCEKLSDSGSMYHGSSILWYYDNERGMPDYDFSSLSITDEAFFQKYLNYFMTELTPMNVLPDGLIGYVCFYPDIKQILGEKTHILHDDLSDPWCIHLIKPYLLSKDIFELLSRYIVDYLNKVSMFEVTTKTIEMTPCIFTSAEIKRICNAEQFFEWVNSHNNLIRHKEGRDFYEYDTFPGDSLENFDMCAEWKGDDSELKKLPLFVDVYRTEFGFSERFEVKHQMRVSIDDDSIIHINLNNREICKNYYEKVRSAMNEVNFWKRIDGVLYGGIWDDLELEHYIQFLIDNNYEQDNKRFISIKQWNDFSRFLSAEESYRMQCHIFVGMELL